MNYYASNIRMRFTEQQRRPSEHPSAEPGQRKKYRESSRGIVSGRFFSPKIDGQKKPARARFLFQKLTNLCKNPDWARFWRKKPAAAGEKT